MSRDLFRDRHPLLYHLREHSREATGLALGFVFVLWLCIVTGSATRRLQTWLSAST